MTLIETAERWQGMRERERCNNSSLYFHFCYGIKVTNSYFCHSLRCRNEHYNDTTNTSLNQGLTNIKGNHKQFLMAFLHLKIVLQCWAYSACAAPSKGKTKCSWSTTWMCWKHNLVVKFVRCDGGLWAVRVPHGRATMRQGSDVNGCDHSFLVNNAAFLIGRINNWWGRVWGGSCSG